MNEPLSGSTQRCDVTIPLHISVSLGQPSVDSFAINPQPVKPAMVERFPLQEALEAAPDRFDERFSLDSLKASQFKWPAALSLALASRLSYADGVAVHAMARGSWKLESCRFFEVDDTECFISSSPAAVLIAFRGTQEVRDWLADFNALSSTRPYGVVHRGFYHQFLAVQAQLEQVLSQFPNRPILLTGHSLGGAVATIAAAEWHNKYNIRAIYTYGQPAVGRGDFVPFMNNSYGTKFFRFVNNNDIVPQVPPNFQHVGRLFQFDSGTHLQSQFESVEVSTASAGQTMSSAEFDQMRAQLLAERAATRRGDIVTESVGRAELESFFPRFSFSDHSLINYITKIATQIPTVEGVFESATSTAVQTDHIRLDSMADYNTVSRALGETKAVIHSHEGFPQSVTSFPKLNRFAERIEDPVQRAAFVSDSVVALSQLQESTDDADPDVFHSPSNQLAALMQSGVDQRAAASVLEFAFDNDDVGAVLDPIRAHPVVPHPIQRPTNDIPQSIPDGARIFLVSDYGTGLYGAPVTSKTILDSGERFDLLLHLGDIYYSGQPDEVQTRFLDVWPSEAGTVSRTLNGNHEMYSGGYSYFDLALPALEQSSSYFALQNSNWLLLGLDTAWVENELDTEQVAWIQWMVQQAGTRKVILFSHHPLFSIKKDPLKNGQREDDGLRQLLDDGKIFAWYWGHEHHCIVYDSSPDYQFHARCIGHGGMPYKRKDLKDLDKVREVGTARWRRLPADHRTPGGRALDGPNEFIVDHEDKYGPHGYVTLHLDGEILTEEFCSPRGEVLLTQAIS